MRTKLDGTDTQVVLKLDNYTTNFRLAGGYLVYLDAEYNLHSIDLNSKKLKDEVVVEEISSAMLTYTSLDSDMGGIFFGHTVSSSKVVSIFVKPSSVVYIIIFEWFIYAVLLCWCIILFGSALIHIVLVLTLW